VFSYSKCLDIIENQLSSLSLEKKPIELYQPIRYILSIGGKRVRPCLAMMSHSLFSDSVESVIGPAMGIELFHNFTLLHDDIMDNARVRRNYPTVNVKWNQNAAILSGDAMMILAYQLISKTPINILPKVLDLFNQTALEVCEGQQLDMNFEKCLDISVEEYLEMIRLKTAVLIAASLATGGITAMADSKDIEYLYRFGLNIGMAFQLQDDYLDVFANNHQFGKSLGGDIVANKKTFLMLKALQSSDKNLVHELETWITRENFNPDEKIESVKIIYEELNIPEKTRQLIETYFTSGFEFFQRIHVSDERKVELCKFVTQIMKREH